MARLEDTWYRPHPLSLLLAPVSWLFCLLVMLRRALYRFGLLRSERLAVPVVVVGNITVGGSGKSPLVQALAEELTARGRRPGLISRGYGGHAEHWPQSVHPDSDPDLVGDEPVMLVRACGCPMVVGPDRVAAARRLLQEHPQVDVILSDDGMQHYRLGRDVEIAVLDGRRRLGNRRCLPAGPLREPPSRLKSVDFVVCNGKAGPRELPMSLVVEGARRVDGQGGLIPLSELSRGPVHAVAGIGHPQRFFDTLDAAGVDVIPHPFSDHHRFSVSDLAFGDERPVVMTAKDAVKCQAFAAPHHWYVSVRAQLPQSFLDGVWAKLQKGTA